MRFSVVRAGTHTTLFAAESGEMFIGIIVMAIVMLVAGKLSGDCAKLHHHFGATFLVMRL